MIFLIFSGVCAVLSIVMWLVYTAPILDREFQETIRFPSSKLPVAFVMDAIKAIHLFSVNGRKIPIAIQAHVILLILSIVFALGYAAKLDGII